MGGSETNDPPPPGDNESAGAAQLPADPAKPTGDDQSGPKPVTQKFGVPNPDGDADTNKISSGGVRVDGESETSDTSPPGGIERPSVDKPPAPQPTVHVQERVIPNPGGDDDTGVGSTDTSDSECRALVVVRDEKRESNEPDIDTTAKVVDAQQPQPDDNNKSTKYDLDFLKAKLREWKYHIGGALSLAIGGWFLLPQGEQTITDTLTDQFERNTELSVGAGVVGAGLLWYFRNSVCGAKHQEGGVVERAAAAVVGQDTHDLKKNGLGLQGKIIIFVLLVAIGFLIYIALTNGQQSPEAYAPDIEEGFVGPAPITAPTPMAMTAPNRFGPTAYIQKLRQNVRAAKGNAPTNLGAIIKMSKPDTVGVASSGYMPSHNGGDEFVTKIPGQR